jgi:cobalt-zinc-cadmium efflux system outer membrane protein
MSLFTAAISATAVSAADTVLPSHLTLDNAVALFRAHGFDLLVADAAVRSAEGDVKIAGAIPNPSFGTSFGHVFTYQPNDPSCAQSNATCSANAITFDLNDQAALSTLLSGKRGLRLKVAEIALAAARESRADAERALLFQVKQAYIQAVLARDQLDFALEVQESSTQTLKLNQVRYEKGAIPEVDVAKVEVEKLEADQAVASARQALSVAKAGLAFLIGVRGNVPEYDVDPDLPKYVLPAPLVAGTAESLLVEALATRPDLRAQTYQRDSSDAALHLARRMRIPDVALDANFSQAGSGGAGTNVPLQPPTLTVGISLPVPIFYNQKGEVQKAEATLSAQDIQRSKVEAQVRSDVEQAFSNFASTREQVERMEARLLDRAKLTRDLTRFQYEKGAASLLEFLDAQRTFIATNGEYLQDLANYWIAVFQVEEAVGKEFRQ